MKVILAIDGSPHGDAAVEAVRRRSWPAGSEIRVITVDAPIDAGFVRSGPTTFDELVTELRDQARACLLKGVQSLASLPPEVKVSHKLLVGSPQQCILDEAAQWGADLIVVGSHGKGFFARHMLGSVSMAMALYAPCSVEIVRSPPSAVSNEPELESKEL